jgi:hypothetical protein
MSTGANANPPPPPLPANQPTKDGISDSFTANVFHGRTNEYPIEWLTNFEQYTDYKKIKDADKVAFFKLLLRGNAADWIASENSTTWADI